MSSSYRLRYGVRTVAVRYTHRSSDQTCHEEHPESSGEIYYRPASHEWNNETDYDVFVVFKKYRHDF